MIAHERTRRNGAIRGMSHGSRTNPTWRAIPPWESNYRISSNTYAFRSQELRDLLGRSVIRARGFEIARPAIDGIIIREGPSWQ